MKTKPFYSSTFISALPCSDVIVSFDMKEIQYPLYLHRRHLKLSTS